MVSLLHQCLPPKYSPTCFPSPRKPQNCGISGFDLLSGMLAMSPVFVLSPPVFSKAVDLGISDNSFAIPVFVGFFSFRVCCQFSLAHPKRRSRKANSSTVFVGDLHAFRFGAQVGFRPNGWLQSVGRWLELTRWRPLLQRLGTAVSRPRQSLPQASQDPESSRSAQCNPWVSGCRTCFFLSGNHGRRRHSRMGTSQFDVGAHMGRKRKVCSLGG